MAFTLEMEYGLMKEAGLVSGKANRSALAQTTLHFDYLEATPWNQWHSKKQI